MKTIAAIILAVCVFGAPLMFYIFATTGKPMALLNGVWAAGLIVWTISILRSDD